MDGWWHYWWVDGWGMWMDGYTDGLMDARTQVTQCNIIAHRAYALHLIIEHYFCIAPVRIGLSN